MMKKFTILAALLALSFSAFSKVKQPSEDSLDNDLNYRLDQSSDHEREVASDNEESDVEKNSQDSEREVASENEELEAPIQYWKY